MTKRRLFDIAKMRHRIAVYRISRTEDGSGGFDRSDPSLKDLIGHYWGYIRPVSLRERQWGEQFTEVVTHVCWLRYNTVVQEGMTVRRVTTARSIDYYVHGIYDPDNLQEFLVLMLREGGPL